MPAAWARNAAAALGAAAGAEIAPSLAALAALLPGPCPAHDAAALRQLVDEASCADPPGCIRSDPHGLLAEQAPCVQSAGLQPRAKPACQGHCRTSTPRLCCLCPDTLPCGAGMYAGGLPAEPSPAGRGASPEAAQCSGGGSDAGAAVGCMQDAQGGSHVDACAGGDGCFDAGSDGGFDGCFDGDGGGGFDDGDDMGQSGDLQKGRLPQAQLGDASFAGGHALFTLRSSHTKQLLHGLLCCRVLPVQGEATGPVISASMTTMQGIAPQCFPISLPAKC